MTAEIPFNFRAGGAVLSAGTYQVSASSGAHTAVRLANVDTKKSAMVVTQYRSDAPKASGAGHPKLWFACVASNCVLTSVWNGSDTTVQVVGSPARSGKEIAEIREVNLTVVKTE